MEKEMGGGRERLADLLQDAVSFGAPAAPRGAAPAAQRKRAPRKPEEEAAIMRRTSAGGRVAHAINELAKKIRHSRNDDSLSTLMGDWVEDLRKSHAGNVPASGEGGGTVMENAMVAKYNGGYETLGFTKDRPYYGGDGRAWLVYHALGGADIEPVGGDIQRRKTQLNDIQSATRGHHVTGKYRQSASQRHKRLVEQIRRSVLEALNLEEKDPGLYKVEKIFTEIESARERAKEPNAREPDPEATSQDAGEREPALGAFSALGAPHPKAATSAARQAKQPAAKKARERNPAASVSHEEGEPRRSGRTAAKSAAAKEAERKSAAAKEAESGTTVAVARLGRSRR